MAGLTSEGFTPETLEDIQNRIKANLEILSPGFDFSPESPDGQLLGIMAFEISQAWNELSVVYKAYDPSQATGAALRNLGILTGIVYGAATRSAATVTLDGIDGTLVPAGSLVSDADGNDFETQFNAKVPSAVDVVSVLSGIIPVPAGSITIAKTVIADWTGVTQALDGKEGDVAQTETAYRNLRNRTVLRNYTGVDETMSGRLYELGFEQVSVFSNNETIAGPDGTPANTIHITVSPDANITNEEVARVILNTKPSGVSTFGNTTVVLDDSLGNSHTINFTTAISKPVFISVDVTYLESSSGAKENIEQDLIAHINSLQVGEDVIYSRLFGIITAYGKAQVNTLTIDFTASPLGTSNLAISPTEAASTILANIIVTET